MVLHLMGPARRGVDLVADATAGRDSVEAWSVACSAMARRVGTRGRRSFPSDDFRGRAAFVEVPRDHVMAPDNQTLLAYPDRLVTVI